MWCPFSHIGGCPFPDVQRYPKGKNDETLWACAQVVHRYNNEFSSSCFRVASNCKYKIVTLCLKYFAVCHLRMSMDVCSDCLERDCRHRFHQMILEQVQGAAALKAQIVESSEAIWSMVQHNLSQACIGMHRPVWCKISTCPTCAMTIPKRGTSDNASLMFIVSSLCMCTQGTPCSLDLTCYEFHDALRDSMPLALGSLHIPRSPWSDDFPLTDLVATALLGG